MSSFAPRLVQASQAASGEIVHQPREALRTVAGVPTRIAVGVISTGAVESSKLLLYPITARRRPSAVTRAKPRPVMPVVIGVASPCARPVCSSTGTRQMFIVPPRSLEKYSDAPSGAHSGDQSVAASCAIGTGDPPPTSTVQMSRWPPVFAQ